MSPRHPRLAGGEAAAGLELGCVGDFGGFCASLQTFPSSPVAGLAAVDVLMGARQPVSIPNELLVYLLPRLWGRGLPWDLAEACPPAGLLLGRSSAGCGFAPVACPPCPGTAPGSCPPQPRAAPRRASAPVISPCGAHPGLAGGSGATELPGRVGSRGWVLLGDFSGGRWWRQEGWWKALWALGAVQETCPGSFLLWLLTPPSPRQAPKVFLRPWSCPCFAP